MAAQFVVGLVHLEGCCLEKNGLSAYYWLRLAEASSCELGNRSRLLVEQIRSSVQAHEIEGQVFAACFPLLRGALTLLCFVVPGTFRMWRAAFRSR